MKNAMGYVNGVYGESSRYVIGFDLVNCLTYEA